MTTASWLTPVSGSWGDGADWSTNIPPDDAGTDVIINAGTTIDPGTGNYPPYVITIDSGTSYTVNSVAVDNAAVGATLAIDGTLNILGDAMALDGNVTLGGGALSVAGTLDPYLISGLGTLTAGTIDDDSGYIAAFGTGTLLLDPTALDVSLRPAAIVNDFLYDLNADYHGTLVVAPTTPLGNLSAGTLTGGSFGAEDYGILILPPNNDVVTDDSIIGLQDFGVIESLNTGTAQYDSIETTLQTIAAGAELLLGQFQGWNSTANFVDLGLLRSEGGDYFETASLTIGAGGTFLGDGDILIGSYNQEFEFNVATIVSDGTITAGVGASGGTLSIDSPITGSGSMDILGLATLRLFYPSAQDVTFENETAGFEPTVYNSTLALGSMAAFSGTIYNFSSVADVLGNYDGIDLTGLSYYDADVGKSFAAANGIGTLFVTSSGSTVAELFFQGVTTDIFTLNFDGNYGTLINASCFAAGTRIAVPDGEVPVETLKVGQHVLTFDGRRVPVCWIGHRHVNCRLHPRPEQVWPMRVPADCFGPGMPDREVFLSPDHAVFVDGMLVPIRFLNGVGGIVQVSRDSVAYWHVELPRHDILRASGLACESYLDTGDRCAFDNGGVVTRLHPEFGRWRREAETYAPLVLHGPALERIRAKLDAERAARRPRVGERGAHQSLGYQVFNDPAAASPAAPAAPIAARARR